MNQVQVITREDGSQDRFGYYDDGELKWATYAGGGSATYALDLAGNRTSVIYGGYGTVTYTPNVINQYTTADTSGVINGSEHEISSAWGANYTYINDGQLSQIVNGTTSTQYAYDALRRLVRRGINGATNRYEIYDGERSILEYNINGAIVGRNVYGKGIDEMLMRTATGINGGLPFYYQQDHAGSVTQLTNGAGAIIEKYLYDAFGAVTYLNPSGTDIGASAYGNSILFTGRRKLTWDTYEYRARIYNAYLGRFMSEDPKLFDAGDYNLFRYCHNDPLDLTDPTGLAGNDYQNGVSRRSEDRANDFFDAQWAMAKWADRSNNFSGEFAAFASEHGLSMGQVSTSGQNKARSAGESGRIYSSAYGVKDNDPPGNGISTRGQNGNFTATLDKGSYERPTTLAVSKEWLRNGDAKGYFREGDLVNIASRGWFRVEDWCGACDRTRRIDQWTGDTDARQQARLTHTVDFRVFHPHESVPSTLQTDQRPATMDY